MLSFFPLDVLDEIWDVIESVSEEFLTYSRLDLRKNRSEFYLITGVFFFGDLNQQAFTCSRQYIQSQLRRLANFFA